ncbi:Eco57I restriction-modification methylase domain-containing protein [Helicobacter marmotae]|uniref:Eco57I restriction-modification methylase domain-containing protein n=1 Tax=Helicobacter marmotae TaxID=152490 RepID=UPI0039899A9A
MEEGWDIVLGNPPYLQIPKGDIPSETFPFSEGKDKGKQNLYKVFVEHGYNLVTQDSGVFCLITQSSIMCDLSSSHTRELLLTQTSIKQCVEFPKIAPTKEGQVFKTALQGTCILLCTKATPLKSHSFKLSINNDKTTISKLCFESIKQDSILSFYPHRFEIPLIKQGEMALIQKIKHDKVLLGSMLEGTLQGNINTTKLKQIQSHSPTNILIIKGENCHRYYQDSQMMYGIENNELILKALKNNKDKNIITTQNITGTTDTFRIHANFVESKNTNFVFLDSVNISYSRNSSEAKFIVGLLNSKLLDWLFRKTSTNNHVNKYELEDLPIPKITASNQRIADSIIALSDEILALKAQDSSADTSHLEVQIDNLVYALYGLSEEEIHIMQGR